MREKQRSLSFLNQNMMNWYLKKLNFIDLLFHKQIQNVELSVQKATSLEDIHPAFDDKGNEKPTRELVEKKPQAGPPKLNPYGWSFREGIRISWKSSHKYWRICGSRNLNRSWRIELEKKKKEARLKKKKEAGSKNLNSSSRFLLEKYKRKIKMIV